MGIDLPLGTKIRFLFRFFTGAYRGAFVQLSWRLAEWSVTGRVNEEENSRK